MEAALLILVLLFIAWRLLRGFTQGVAAVDIASLVPAHRWERTGKFAVDVVGESRYQAAIEAAVEARVGKVAEIDALLIPEDSNPYDSKAVMVAIMGKTVGYLSREDAREFRVRLKRGKLEGKPTVCTASFIGGGPGKSFGVVLDLKPFTGQAQ